MTNVNTAVLFMSMIPLAIALPACSASAPGEDVGEQAASVSRAVTAHVVGTESDGLNIRSGPNTTGAPIGHLPEGSALLVTCQVHGERIDGTDLWDLIAQPRGYVFDAYVRTGSNARVSAPRCNATNGGGSTTPSSSGGLSAIWGGGPAPISFEYLAYGGPDLYGYGTNYGLDGDGHTGLDVGVPFGTTLFAPMAGELTCAGTGDGSGVDGGGCAAFNDTGNNAPYSAPQGVGRIELHLDDGTLLILGHARTCSLRPGSRVERGQRVGTSGGMNGPHVHVETRIRDASTPSGWRIVSPRTRLGT